MQRLVDWVPLSLHTHLHTLRVLSPFDVKADSGCRVPVRYLPR
ncbi:hypothetical protein R69658_07315 [Paraburkholderia aspalathi]|jgi:hypothetical protein|uniref:Uncharacterized protein n=1 Tax=Paraburkholderia aspalathi TaxID=1324617 RepID=A0ABM8T334_9BURK|nr:hypothetical protein [Paraburkholderia sediminicola]CAE6854247.1 hypothetical protein R69658_07315 [Paraburkholderia aspalathi]